MTSEFCPRCGQPRTGSLRFCRGCQFDFLEPTGAAGSTQPMPVPPPDPTRGSAPEPVAPATRVESTVTAGPAWQPPPPSRDRPWLRWVLVGAAIVLILGAIGSLTSEDPDETVTAGEPTAAATVAPVATPTPTPTPTATPTAEASPSATPEIDTTVPLELIDPQNGGTVASANLVVRGTAPPNATITRDVLLLPDDHTVADSTGAWAMPVRLSDGENQLKFRLGDDKASTVILIVYLDEPTTPAPSRTPVPEPTPIGAVGESIRIGDWIILVHGISQLDSTNQFIKPDVGNRFWVLDVALKNDSGASDVVGAGWQVRDSLGFVHDAEFIGIKDPQLGGEVLSGGSIRGYLTYQMAKSATPVAIVYTPGWFDDPILIKVP